MFGPLSFKLRVLAKQVSEDFMHSFLGLIALGNPPVLGCPSLEESYPSLAHWLTSHLPGAKQFEVKEAEAAPLLGR